eukprot:11155599-Alexandrium_andersonii.AAC.1
MRKTFTRQCDDFKSDIQRNNGLLMSLHSAKHRFESLAAPMGMWVMWFVALLHTAREIAIRRDGSEVLGRRLIGPN